METTQQNIKLIALPLFIKMLSQREVNTGQMELIYEGMASYLNFGKSDTC